jgi:hydrogenase maturation protein HypF
MTKSVSLQDDSIVCYEIRVAGRVQGVGFRPFVYRLARQYNLTGQVRNVGGEVHITVSGDQASIESFERALISQAPMISRPHLLSSQAVEQQKTKDFHIVSSEPASSRHIHVPPDFFTCDDCLNELNDPSDRRYRYPFINCTQCGPRYTLINRMPYDRPYTSMMAFELCPVCEFEYRDPADRRYHAEPLACPQCGPQLTYQSEQLTISDNESALSACVSALEQGELVAIKGIGGYHLCCDAQNDTAIKRLRKLKSRPHKPLAVMFPQAGTDGLERVRHHVSLDDTGAELLASPMRPILLADKKPDCTLPLSVAPDLDQLGVMLPYSPLHHLLLDKLQRPMIATSANISGEPVLTDNEEVQMRLQHVTKTFLHHNRDIVRPADDSVFRIIARQPRTIRAGRGQAPLEMSMPFSVKQPMLACGGHMKNTIALAFGDRIVVSPHIGDMGSVRSRVIFENVIEDLQRLYQVQADVLVCDAHPDYATSRWAREQKRSLVEVFHHHAHAACLPGEFLNEQNWLVFAWDGVGYGCDQTLWGGETFYGRAGQWQRVASMRPFRLPGGDRASREPWRSAMAIFWEMQQPATQQLVNNETVDLELLHDAWQKRINAPVTTAMGRLFDAAASILDLCHTASHEGQAPMLLESMAQQGRAHAVSLPINVKQDGMLETDWEPLFNLLQDKRLAKHDAAFAFHLSMADAMLEQAKRLREQHGDFAVGLSGGVFQNRLLSELALEKFKQENFRAYLPIRLPVNDGGLCFGQIIEAAAMSGQRHE